MKCLGILESYEMTVCIVEMLIVAFLGCPW